MPHDHDASTDETGNGRIIAAGYLSMARVNLDLMAETLEDYEVTFTLDRVKGMADQIRVARGLIDALADEIMEPFEVANVLQNVEEVLAIGDDANRLDVLRALVDTRQYAREQDELEPTDDQLANRPGMEGGIGYPMFDGRDEHDPSL